MRKPRAADRLCYFIILLWLRSGCFAHRSSQTNNRSSPIVTETPTKHCTPLALALKLVPSGCRTACLNFSHSPTLRRSSLSQCLTEKMGNALPTLPQCAFHMCFLTHVPSTVRSQSRNGAPPRWQHRSPAMATAYSPLLSPARESEEVAAAMWEHIAATRHTVKVRVECSTKRQAKLTRP